MNQLDQYYNFHWYFYKNWVERIRSNLTELNMWYEKWKWKWSHSVVSNSAIPWMEEPARPGSSVHGIFQARVLEWVPISFSRESSQPRDWTQVSCIVGRSFTIWATREVGGIFISISAPWKLWPGLVLGNCYEEGESVGRNTWSANTKEKAWFQWNPRSQALFDHKSKCTR